MYEQKVLRLFPSISATPYKFDSSVANGFPRTLPPIGKTGLGRRAVAGMMFSEKLSDGGIAQFESSLERDFYVLLEFSESVVRWDPQPIRLPLADSGKGYVPDVLVSYLDNLRDPSSTRRVLYEVKYRDELWKNWAGYPAA